MKVATGTVIAGKVVVEGLELAEGETVTILSQEADSGSSPVSRRGGGTTRSHS